VVEHKIDTGEYICTGTKFNKFSYFKNCI